MSQHNDSILGHILNIVMKTIGIVVYSATKIVEKIFVAFNNWLNGTLKK